MRDAIEYWAVAGVRAVATRLPEAIVRAWGSTLGLMFYALDRAHRRVALTNLEQCFPNKPAGARRAIARATFMHFGQVLLRLLTFSALSPEQMVARAEYEGDERVRLAYARGKGVLFFTGHFGFWECQAMAHGVKLRPIGVLARTLDNQRLNDLLERIRTSTGNHVIYRQGAVRRVLKTLAAGEGVAMLIDQHMHSPDAIWVSFFRRPAATTSTLAAIAIRTGPSDHDCGGPRHGHQSFPAKAAVSSSIPTSSTPATRSTGSAVTVPSFTTEPRSAVNSATSAAATSTTRRPADSENRAVATSPCGRSSTDAPSREAMHISASATARPPSLTSWQAATKPARIAWCRAR